MNIQEFIEVVHKGQKRMTGEKYTSHLYAVRDILVEEGVKSNVILNSALLHDVLEDTDVKREYLELWFGERVANIVFYLSKSKKIFWNTDYCRLQSHINLLEECWREYPEVILIKMADKLHNLRTISAFRKEKQRRFVDSTQNVFLPLFKLAYKEYLLKDFTVVINSLLKKLKVEIKKIDKKLESEGYPAVKK